VHADSIKVPRDCREQGSMRIFGAFCIFAEATKQLSFHGRSTTPVRPVVERLAAKRPCSQPVTSRPRHNKSAVSANRWCRGPGSRKTMANAQVARHGGPAVTDSNRRPPRPMPIAFPAPPRPKARRTAQGRFPGSQLFRARPPSPGIRPVHQGRSLAPVTSCGDSRGGQSRVP